MIRNYNLQQSDELDFNEKKLRMHIQESFKDARNNLLTSLEHDSFGRIKIKSGVLFSGTWPSYPDEQNEQSFKDFQAYYKEIFENNFEDLQKAYQATFAQYRDERNSYASVENFMKHSVETENSEWKKQIEEKNKQWSDELDRKLEINKKKKKKIDNDYKSVHEKECENDNNSSDWQRKWGSYEKRFAAHNSEVQTFNEEQSAFMATYNPAKQKKSLTDELTKEREKSRNKATELNKKSQDFFKEQSDLTEESSQLDQEEVILANQRKAIDLQSRECSEEKTELDKECAKFKQLSKLEWQKMIDVCREFVAKFLQIEKENVDFLVQTGTDVSQSGAAGFDVGKGASLV